MRKNCTSGSVRGVPGNRHSYGEAGGVIPRRFLQAAKEQGAERVSVTAYAANERAGGFYRKMGFAPKSLTLELGL